MGGKFDVIIVRQKEGKSYLWTNLRATGARSGHWERMESYAGGNGRVSSLG